MSQENLCSSYAKSSCLLGCLLPRVLSGLNVSCLEMSVVTYYSVILKLDKMLVMNWKVQIPPKCDKR